MNSKKIVVTMLGFLMLSSVFAITVNAVDWPNLPSTVVQLTVVDGTTSYFDSTLSGVTAGFDVSNGEYPGWCIDRSTTMTRGIAHDVMLYSSLEPPAEVGIDLATFNKINYILNHKQGEMMDVQQAIWYILGDIDLGDISETAEEMADAAQSTYTPPAGGILAVICLPQEDPDAQNSIIEIIIPTLPPPGGKVTGGGQCIVGDNKEIPSASFGFNAMWFSRDAAPKGEINYVDHTTGQHVHVHILDYLAVWEDLPGNKPHPMRKAIFGGIDVYSGKMVDVYIEDNGEPGKNDKFLIFLDGAYLGGSGDYFGSLLTTDPILAGNIQIHKPPH